MISVDSTGVYPMRDDDDCDARQAWRNVWQQLFQSTCCGSFHQAREIYENVKSIRWAFALIKTKIHGIKLSIFVQFVKSLKNFL